MEEPFPSYLLAPSAAPTEASISFDGLGRGDVGCSPTPPHSPQASVIAPSLSDASMMAMEEPRGGAKSRRPAPMTEMVFVSPANLDSSLQAINEMLRSEGFPAPLPRSTSSKDTAFTANLVYLILQSRAQREERVAEQEETIKRCQFDLQVSRQHGARLQGDLHRREEECKALTLKLSNSVEKAKKERERLGGERDKAAAECVSMRHRDAQREHAMRKLEMERDKLKEKLRVVVASPKERERVPASAGAGSGRVVSPSKQNMGEDEELLRKVIRGGEEREKLLMEENAAMRKALGVLHSELAATLNQSNPPMSRDAESMMQLPFDMVEKEIHASLRDKMGALRKRISDMDGTSMVCGAREGGTEGGVSRQYVDHLEMRIAESEMKLSEQERLIQAYLSHQQSQLDVAGPVRGVMIDVVPPRAREAEEAYRQEAYRQEAYGGVGADAFTTPTKKHQDPHQHHQQQQQPTFESPASIATTAVYEPSPAAATPSPICKRGSPPSKRAVFGQPTGSPAAIHGAGSDFRPTTSSQTSVFSPATSSQTSVFRPTTSSQTSVFSPATSSQTSVFSSTTSVGRGDFRLPPRAYGPGEVTADFSRYISGAGLSPVK